jgi:hypothetical protein
MSERVAKAIEEADARIPMDKRIEWAMLRVERMASELKAEVEPFGTKEQWEAVVSLQRAHYQLHGALGWLLRHQERTS